MTLLTDSNQEQKIKKKSLRSIGAWEALFAFSPETYFWYRSIGSIQPSTIMFHMYVYYFIVMQRRWIHNPLSNLTRLQYSHTHTLDILIEKPYATKMNFYQRIIENEWKSVVTLMNDRGSPNEQFLLHRDRISKHIPLSSFWELSFGWKLQTLLSNRLARSFIF